MSKDKCYKCGTKVKESQKFCRECGTKVVHQKETKIEEAPKKEENKQPITDTEDEKEKNTIKKSHELLPILKNTKFIIVASILLILIIGYLAYCYFTVNTISSPALSAPPSTAGDGINSLSIPVYAVNKLGFKFNTPVTAQTTIGTVNVVQNNTEYEVIFTPPKLAAQSEATITIYTGSISRSVIVSILPDEASKIIESSTNQNILADGTSGTTISVEVSDANGNIVPDNTQILFSLTGGGTISAQTCNTYNGKCSVAYTASIFPGEVSISASSGKASQNINIELQALPPSTISISPGANSLSADSKSTTTIVVVLKNKLGNPVINSPITFTSNLGSLNIYTCNTDNSGQCNLIFKSANVAGTSTISACAQDSICSTAQLILEPTPNLQVLNFNMNSYVGGNPNIIPVFAINTNYLGIPMTTLQVQNTGSGEFKGQISVSIPDWSSSDVKQIDIPAGSTQSLTFSPALNTNSLTNSVQQSVSYSLTITDKNSNIVYQNSYPTNLAPFNTIDWLGGGYTSLISAWISNSNEIHTLLSNAANSLPGKAIVGYQTYSTGCGFLGLSSCDQTSSTRLQVQAIYNELQTMNMHYVNAPNSFSGTQTIYTPTQSINAGGANCIDGTLVFANAVVETGMTAYVALVPGHAFVCVQVVPNQNIVDCVETTMIGGGSSFSQAETEGNTEFSTYSTNKQITLINVNIILSQKVNTIS